MKLAIYHLSDNRPFAGYGHMVLARLPAAVRVMSPRSSPEDSREQPIEPNASNAVGISKQRKVRLDWYEVVLEVPLRYLRPSVIYSVPCDRILQRAY